MIHPRIIFYIQFKTEKKFLLFKLETFENDSRPKQIIFKNVLIFYKSTVSALFCFLFVSEII